MWISEPTRGGVKYADQKKYLFYSVSTFDCIVFSQWEHPGADFQDHQKPGKGTYAIERYEVYRA